MLMTRGLRLHVGAVGDKEFRAVVTLIFGGFFFFLEKWSRKPVK